jgi:hypothetical protein
MPYSAATYETSYLNPASASCIRTAAGRGQVAGVLNALRRQVTDGQTYPNAHAISDVPYRLNVLDRAAALSNDATVKSNYLLIDS